MTTPYFVKTPVQLRRQLGDLSPKVRQALASGGQQPTSIVVGVERLYLVQERL